MVFPSLPPSLKQTGVRVEALRYRGDSGMKPSPHGSPPASPEKEDIQKLTPCSLGILIVGALWRKSWKANWMWGLEAVRERSFEVVVRINILRYLQRAPSTSVSSADQTSGKHWH